MDETTVSSEPEVTTAEAAEPASDPYAGSVFEGLSADWLNEPATPEPTAAEGAESEPEQEAPAPELHRIKVRGEEREVPYEQLIAMAQQGEDYTIKTQEIAEQRRMLAPLMDLYDKLRQSPQATLAELARQYGVEIGQAPAAGEEGYDSWFSDTETPEPQTALDRRLAALEAAEQKRAIDAQTAQHMATLNGLHEQFGEFDDFELVKYADQHGHPNLISAYRDLHWDRRPAAKQERDSEREDADEAIREAKRQASAVHSGTAKTAGSFIEPAPDLSKMTFDEIGEYTLRQLKLRS